MAVELTSAAKRFAGIVLLRDAQFWRRSRSRRFARYALFACYAYVAVLFALLAFEDRFLFPGATIARPWCDPPEFLHVRELTVETEAGDRIWAWFSAPEGWKPEQGAVLISHGNGGNLSRESGRAYRWRESLGLAVMLYDYPGYGKSTGRPSEARCYSAGEAALKWLVEQHGVPSSEVILVGESLGGAIAVELATRHAVRLLVLEGAFTSFPDMAQCRFPCYPSRYLVHNRMDNEAKIPLIRCPAILTHGTADQVVPFHHGERLFAAAHEPKLFLKVDGGGHGPPNKQEFFETVQVFLAQTSSEMSKGAASE